MPDQLFALHRSGRPYATADFDFDLPPGLIAQHPAAERSAARLLDGRAGPGCPPVDGCFRDLPRLMVPGDLLVFNDTRVLKARLFGHKASGGAVEALVERVLPAAGADHGDQSLRSEVIAHLRASKAPKTGAMIRFGGMAAGFDAEVLGRAGPDGALFWLRLPGDPLALLEAHGHVPLPPYITHPDGAEDAERYQTVFARAPGAVAAPTAALHFDAGVLAALAARGVRCASVTLHVGAGTFQPVRGENLADHVMHSEWYDIPAATVAAIEAAQTAGRRVWAVGTTTLRALESAARATGHLPAQGARGETNIFITPGFEFRVVERLLTNFHLPRSTLMMLVAAFAGYEHVMALYRHAIAARYRFFSYGDAMALARA